jgi:hypothetical protein
MSSVFIFSIQQSIRVYSAGIVLLAMFGKIESFQQFAGWRYSRVLKVRPFPYLGQQLVPEH